MILERVILNIFCEWLSISKDHELRDGDSKYFCEWLSISNTTKTYRLREGDSKYFCEWLSISNTSKVIISNYKIGGFRHLIVYVYFYYAYKS